MEQLRGEELRVLRKMIGTQETLREFGPKRGRYALATFDDYPWVDFKTVVTLGVVNQGGSMWRGLPLGYEQILVHERGQSAAVDVLEAAVLENGKLRASRERRSFIPAGIYAPGYPPHLLFTSHASATPDLQVKKKIGDAYVEFSAAIPIDDRELRQYDRSARALIAELQDPKVVASYPRTETRD